MLRHRLQGTLRLKRKVANPIGLGKKAAGVVNRTGPLTTRSARKGTARNKKQIQRQKKKTESMHRKPSGRLVQQAVRAESPLPPKTQGVQTDPNFFLLTDLKLPDTPFENAESEIGDFLDDEEDEIFHGDLSSEDGFWSPKAYSI